MINKIKADKRVYTWKQRGEPFLDYIVTLTIKYSKVKTVFFKHISDCPRYGKVRGDVGDKVNNLKSIIMPINDDLIDNRLLNRRRNV